MPREGMAGENSREEDGEAVSELRTEPHILDIYDINVMIVDFVGF